MYPKKSIIFNVVANTCLVWSSCSCKPVAGSQEASAFLFHTSNNNNVPIQANGESKNDLKNEGIEESPKEEGAFLRMSFQVLGISSFVIVCVIIVVFFTKYYLCRNSSCSSSTRTETEAARVSPESIVRNKERCVYVNPESSRNSAFPMSPVTKGV